MLLSHLRRKATYIVANIELVDGDDLEKVSWINSLVSIGKLEPHHLQHLYIASHRLGLRHRLAIGCDSVQQLLRAAPELMQASPVPRQCCQHLGCDSGQRRN